MYVPIIIMSFYYTQLHYGLLLLYTIKLEWLLYSVVNSLNSKGIKNIKCNFCSINKMAVHTSL